MAARKRFHVHLVAIWLLSISAALGEYQCPDNANLFRDECIYIDRRPVTWHQAKTKCDSLNASMVTIFDETKSNFLSHFRFRNSWLGLAKLRDEDTFSWRVEDDWVPVNFTNWAPGQPDGWQEDCTMLLANHGLWNDIMCGHVLPYVCEKTAQNGDCGHEWRPFGGNCYKRFYSPTTWFNARNVCQQYDSDLVVIETEEENGFITDFLPAIWIGFSDKKTESEFCWLDQDFSEDTWTNWGIMEPNSGSQGLKDCGYLIGSNTTVSAGYWNVADCMVSLALICEKPATRDGNESHTCDVGWRQWRSSCYLLDESLTRWDFGRKRCQQHDADLVVVESQSENEYLAGRITLQSWIGINDRLGQNIWHWLDDPEREIFTRWADRSHTRFNVYEQHSCVLIYSSSHNLGKWANYRCNADEGYICESPEPFDIVGVTSVYFGGHYYYISSNPMTWLEARASCRLKKANLAVISSEEEQRFINSQLPAEMHIRGFWTGVNSIHRRYHFVALDSNENITYTNWGTSEPNYILQEECVHLNSGWNDHSCEETSATICQKPATGDGRPSYFDFSYGDSVYKIVTGEFYLDQGKKYCSEKFGLNASMAYIETLGELGRIGAELVARFNDREVFWVDERTVPNYISPYSAKEDKCKKLAPRVVFMHGMHTRYKVTSTSCCMAYSLLCEKYIDPDNTKMYDFGFNSSIYKIVLDPAPKAEADEFCNSVFSGGHVVTIDQGSEMDGIAKELLIRHIGEKLEYWVGGNTTQNTEYTSSVLELTSQAGNCVILQHPRFKDHQETDKLALVTASCDEARPFVCEQDIYYPDVFASEKDVSRNLANGSEARIGKTIAHSWKGTSIGLLVSYPFLIGLAIFATLTGYRYYTRQMPFSSGFHKHTDEVHITF